MSVLTMSNYLVFWLDRVSLRQKMLCHLNQQGLTQTSQFLLSILAEIIPDKPYLV